VNRGKFLLLTRLGFAARGLMYILVAWITVRAGRGEDASGALDYLNGGAGRAILAVMALGFASYGLWRVAGAWLDSEGHGSDRKGIFIRLGGAGSGLIHFGFFTYCLRLLFGGHGGGGSSERAEQGAATALSLPGGWTLVMVAAAALLLTGLYQIYKAARAKFLRHLDDRAARALSVQLAGRLGYASRGIVFLAVAYFMAKAGLDERPGEAGGMGEALASLPHAVRIGVASGLGLFGLFSLIEARRRVIRNPADMLPGKG
jgi:hypothetical protein